MKKSGLWICMVLVMSAQVVGARQPVKQASELKYAPLQAFKIPEPERVSLKNGVKLLMLPDTALPLVEGRIVVPIGSRLEPADKVGLASMVGQLWRTGGTRHRSGDDINDLLEGIGAVVESSVSTTQGSVGFSCLSQDLETVMELVAEMLSEPAFAEDKLEITKTSFRSGISRRNDSAPAITRREFTKLVYGANSVYARHVEYSSVDAITSADLHAFHKKHVRPDGLLIGVNGDFEPKQLRKLVKKHFGKWKKSGKSKPFKGGYEPKPSAGVYFVEKADVNQTNVRIGHLGIRVDNKDYFAVQVMNEVFGGGFSARLFSNVRSRKGLAYSVWGSVGSSYDHPGATTISLSTKSQTTVAGIKALHEEIDLMRKAPPTNNELDKAKSAILNSFIFNFDTPDKILARQLSYEYFAYPLDFLDKYRAAIERVTAKDVHRVAKQYLRPENMVQLVVGNSADFDAELTQLGKLTTLDVSIPEPTKQTEDGSR